MHPGPCQVTAAVPSFNLVERDVFGHLLPRRVCRRPAEGGELPHRSEEPEAPTIGDGAQVQCSRSRDLQGAQNKTERSLILTFDRIMQERAGLLVKRDSLTPPRKGLLNQSSVEEDEVGEMVACGQYMTSDLVPRWSASNRPQTSGLSSGTSLSCRPSQHPLPPQLTQDPPLRLI